jgi:hypothetical protein
VTVAAAGDHGKPRPAVIVQTDAFLKNHSFVAVCQLTYAPDRVGLGILFAPIEERGLGLPVWARFITIYLGDTSCLLNPVRPVSLF